MTLSVSVSGVDNRQIEKEDRLILGSSSRSSSSSNGQMVNVNVGKKKERETFAVIGARGRVATGDTEVRTKSAKSAELAKSVSWYTHRHLHRHWHNAHNAEMCTEQRQRHRQCSSEKEANQERGKKMKRNSQTETDYEILPFTCN